MKSTRIHHEQENDELQMLNLTHLFKYLNEKEFEFSTEKISFFII